MAKALSVDLRERLLGPVFKAGFGRTEPPYDGTKSQPNWPFLAARDGTHSPYPGPKAPAAWV